MRPCSSLVQLASLATLALSGCDTARDVDCTSASECVVGEACIANRCVVPAERCDDGKKNGAETDLDCGGTCNKCPTGKACASATDCASGICSGNACAPLRFLATGAVQKWTVPNGIGKVSVKAWGGGGGNAGDSSGGAGGYAAGTLPVSPGETLEIVVGGAGKSPVGAPGAAGGFGGGGSGGAGVDNISDTGGAGGGGRSEVVAKSGAITAGGGGGAGPGGGGLNVPAAGGGYQGQTGSPTTVCHGSDLTGGAAGTGANGIIVGQGGLGCADGQSGSGNGLPGNLLTGGAGGSDPSGGRGRGGGGGGGGFAGGGGGGASDSWSAGVGGGGSGRTVEGGSCLSGNGTTPGLATDAERQGAGDPGADGVVVLRPL